MGGKWKGLAGSDGRLTPTPGHGETTPKATAVASRAPCRCLRGPYPGAGRAVTAPGSGEAAGLTELVPEPGRRFVSPCLGHAATFASPVEFATASQRVRSGSRCPASPPLGAGALRGGVCLALALPAEQHVAGGAGETELPPEVVGQRFGPFPLHACADHSALWPARMSRCGGVRGL